MFRRSWLGVLAASFLFPAGGMHQTQAGDYYSSPPLTPTVKIGPDSEGATPVGEVYGKEYSHTNWFALLDPPPGGGPPLDPNLVNIDYHDAFGVPDPLQVVSWDGLKGGPEGNSGSVDGFDYGVPGFNFPEGQIDALANRSDFLLKQIVRNEATLLFSVTGDVTGTLAAPVAKGHVHYEDPLGPDAASPSDVWAFIETGSAGPGPGPGVNHHVVEDLDALEIWGPRPPSHDNGVTEVTEGYIGGVGGTNTADADRFSLDVDAASGISVWAYDIPTAAISPWVLHSEIVDAVEALFLAPGETFDSRTRDQIDVDGTIARDVGDASPTAAHWGVGDELLFTIDPVETRVVDATGLASVGPAIDGGEIMHLVKTSPGSGPGTFSISFLSHGGHLWDTAFDVSGTFGYLFEDVDALEAVGTLTGDTDIDTPEPSSLLLAFCAMAGFASRRRR